MFNKRNLPIVLLVSVLGIALALKTFAFSSEPPTKYEKILRNVGEMLEEIHYSPKNIDDSFSREVFTKYLSGVDIEKKAFLQSDIQELSKYQNTIDDEILGKTTVGFVPAVDVIYKKRLHELQGICHEILSQPFDYTKQETVNLDYDKMDFPANAAVRRDEVRKKLKYLTLEKYADLLDQQTAAKGKPDYVAKTNAQLEKEARDKTLKIMDRFYDHQLIKANDDDQFNAFVETIVQCMDPHTDYFPPV
ncbi:MAG: tail-specific protease, partial [Chitinophagales bacterium]